MNLCSLAALFDYDYQEYQHMQVQHVAPVEGRWSFYVFLPVSTRPHGCTPFRSLKTRLDFWPFDTSIDSE